MLGCQVDEEAEPFELLNLHLKLQFSLQDRDFRNESETTKHRVSWDTESRCFLDAGGISRSVAHAHRQLSVPLTLRSPNKIMVLFKYK